MKTNWPLTKEFYSLHYFHNADVATLLREAAILIDTNELEVESFAINAIVGDEDVEFTGTLIYGGNINA